MTISRQTRHNLVLLFISLSIAMVMAEVLLRMVLPPPVIWKFPQENYLFDPEVGHWLEQNQRAFTHDKEVTTNSQGLRDGEYARNIPDGVHRILALGDSQTFGNGLLQEDTWPEQLERLLNETGGASVYEVLNGGLPGSDTWQHEIIMGRMLEKYRLNEVILAFYVNDVVTRPDAVRFTQRRDRDAPSARIIYSVKQSVLLLSLRAAFDTVKQMLFPDKGFATQNALVRGEINPAIRKRWDQVELSLAAMKKQADDSMVDFRVVLLPRRDQVDGRVPAADYNRRIEDVLERNGIPYINMLLPLQQSFQEHGKELFIPWDGHNSRLANHVISSVISSRPAGAVISGQ